MLLVFCGQSGERALAGVLRLTRRERQQAPVAPAFSRGLWLLAPIDTLRDTRRGVI